MFISLLLVAALAATTFTFIQAEKEKTFLTHELAERAVTLAESLQMSVRMDLRSNNVRHLKRLVFIFGNRKRLSATAVFDQQGRVLAGTPGILPVNQFLFSQAQKAMTVKQKIADFAPFGGRTSYIYAVPLLVKNKNAGTLVLIFDASFIGKELKEIWKDNFFYFLFQALFIMTMTILIVRWSVAGPIAQIADWLKELREKKEPSTSLPRGDILAPLVEEANRFVKSLSAARAVAEHEAKLRASSEALWTTERLKEQIHLELGDKKFIVVSNREPYMHIRNGRTVQCIVPSGGLVTALDPILRACQGLWIAHGSGDMDRETADRTGKIKVPPEDPRYILRRIWLTKKEEEGYYYGFSNEGLWPLCHITHTRPVFRTTDWVEYQKVNKKFADAILEEISEEQEPLILIQDYHLALLPLLIKAKRPDARIAIFWHVPWPNPEAFGICPWKEEILFGMLGADLIGFHVQLHCNNFLETVDQLLESRIDWEHFYVERQGKLTWVKPFPISVAFPTLEDTPPELSDHQLREEIFREIEVSPKFLALGVDRIDYTKGIVERLNAIERFLEKYPQYIGQFTFVELGSPSRTHIKQYHDLIGAIEEAVDKINWRFQTNTWKPVVFLQGHHSHQTIRRFYRACQVCMVTSLHDGMNLVSKEFIACRDHESGVLILSRFTGASRELRDALLVNPYDTEETADALYRALTMPLEEQQKRMKHLRQVIKEKNVYGWAANLIAALARIRLVEPSDMKA